MVVRIAPAPPSSRRRGGLARQLQAEARSRLRRRQHFDPPVMRPDDGLGDEEPQAEAVAAPDLLPARFEWMEDAGQHVGGNLPLVVHLGDNQFLAGVDLHLDGRARRTVLDGVAHQVRDRLRQPVRVPLADRLALAAKLESVLFRNAVELVEDLPADRAQIGASGGEGNAGALPLAGEVQQIADDVPDPLRAAQHPLRGAFPDGGFRRLQARRAGAAPDGRGAAGTYRGFRGLWMPCRRMAMIRFSKSRPEASTCSPLRSRA